MTRFLTRFQWLALPLAATLAACGGGTDGTGATPPQSNATSSGVMVKGSIILNGVRYDDAGATISDDRNRTSAQLATGMVVRLRGTNNGTSGSAARVQVENEVRGPIQSIDATANPQSFRVGGLVVLVDATTVFANVANFAALVVGNRVEVHGLRDAANNVRASRVELVGQPSATEGFDEVRGTVGNLNTGAKQFTLNGTLTVNYAAATFAPVPGASEASLAGANVVVEVHGTLAGGVFNATLVDIEDLEDAEFRGNTNEHQDVEGFVTGFTATPGTFQVNGRTVTTTAATVYVDGSAADLANNVQVEAEGTINASGVLVASKIKFEHARIQIVGLATSVTPGTRTLVVLGQTVQANDLTRIDARVAGGGNSTSLADITPNIDCVQVRGALVGAVFVADEIKEPSGCGKDLVQAPVTAKNGVAFTLQFFNSLQSALGGGTVQFRDRNGAALSRDAFFAAVTPASAGTAGTLVKVKGTLTTGVLVAEEAELEN